MEKDFLKVIIGGAFFYYQANTKLLHQSIDAMDGTISTESLNKYQKLELQNQIDSYNETHTLVADR